MPSFINKPMKLGICYMVFDGVELLEFALKAIRSEIDHISVTYQTVSYFGNQNDVDIVSIIKDLESQGLIDESLHFHPDLSVSHPKYNELKLRNLGLEMSRKAGCTHHISADVDELYVGSDLKRAKELMEGYDYSISHYSTYYKEPTYLVVPEMNYPVSFMHTIDNEYVMDFNFPHRIEITRRLKKHENCKLFTREEFCIHHMSYVRKDIRKKFLNSDNGRFYKIDKFVRKFDKYKLGEFVQLVPDFLNRRTIEVPNIFNIEAK